MIKLEKITLPPRNRAWTWTAETHAARNTAKLLMEMSITFSRNGNKFVAIGSVGDTPIVTRIALQSGATALTELLP